MNKEAQDVSQSNAMNRKSSQIGAENIQLKIDPEIKFLAPPLGREEYILLERSLKDKGCLDPIKCWEGHNIIVDGQNRHEICTRLGLRYDTIQMRFETREDVMNFVIDHQLGRRNLSDLEKSYLRGKRYITEKKAAHRPDSSELHQSDGVKGETAKKIGERTGVSQATVERDARLAEAIDKLREKVGDEFSKRLRAGSVKISKRDTVALSKKASDVMKSLVEQIEKGKKLSQAEEILGIKEDSSSEPPNDDRYLKKIESHLNKVIEILEQIETIAQFDRAIELSEVSQRICDLLREIGAKNPDSPSQIEADSSDKPLENDDPEAQDENPESDRHVEDGSKDNVADYGSDSTESNPSNSMDDSTKLPKDWEEYEEAIKKEESSKE